MLVSGRVSTEFTLDGLDGLILSGEVPIFTQRAPSATKKKSKRYNSDFDQFHVEE